MTELDDLRARHIRATELATLRDSVQEIAWAHRGWQHPARYFTLCAYADELTDDLQLALIGQEPTALDDPEPLCPECNGDGLAGGVARPVPADCPPEWACDDCPVCAGRGTLAPCCPICANQLVHDDEAMRGWCDRCQVWGM